MAAAYAMNKAGLERNENIFRFTNRGSAAKPLLDAAAFGLRVGKNRKTWLIVKMAPRCVWGTTSHALFFISHKSFEMWNTLIPAIMPFVGVIIGAAITIGANYVLAVRKEKAEEALVARKEAAEAAKDNVVRANELRIAARLVRNEFVRSIRIWISDH